MATKLLVVSAIIILFGIITDATAQYRNAGYGYGGYGHHSRPYYQQQRPQFAGYPQNGYQGQLPPGVSVQEAEWVCKNPKTGDMMIIATDDGLNSRNNGPIQWHQVNLPNNQANNVKPEPTFVVTPNNQANYVQPQPTFGQVSSGPTAPQVNPIYTITEKAPSPVWPNNSNYQPNQPHINPTIEMHATTERESGPIWSSGDDTTTKKTVYTTPSQPIDSIWLSADEKKNKNSGNNRFTTADELTIKKPFYNNPFFDATQKPKTTVTTTTESDDDGPIEIIMGK